MSKDHYKEILDRYEEVTKQMAGDDELIIRVLLKMYGGAQGVWDEIHSTLENEAYSGSEGYATNTGPDVYNETIMSMELSLQDAVAETIEQEFLMDRIDTITKTKEGYKLRTTSGKEVDITDREVKEKIILQNKELAFDHFAGLMEESDILEVFRIVDLFYVE